MTAPEGKPWLCKSCGATLGYYSRKQQNDYHIEILSIMAGPNLIELDGHARITCACGKVREWMIGEEAMERLIEMVRGS
jgi:hypothetical protein